MILLKAIPGTRMPREVRIPAWYLLLVAVLGTLSGCESLRDLGRFARHQHAAPGKTLGIELKRPPSDSAFLYLFLQMDMVAIYAAIRDWTIAQISDGRINLYQMVCDAKTLLSSIVSTAGGGSRRMYSTPRSRFSAAHGTGGRFPADGVGESFSEGASQTEDSAS
jgi:hypothetical protein